MTSAAVYSISINSLDIQNIQGHGDTGYQKKACHNLTIWQSKKGVNHKINEQLGGSSRSFNGEIVRGKKTFHSSRYLFIVGCGVTDLLIKFI